MEGEPFPRGKPGVPSLVDRDPELEALMRLHMERLSINGLRRLCIETFGAGRVPSRSVVHRWVQRQYPGTAAERLWQRRAAEDVAFVELRMGHMGSKRIHAELVQSNPGRRVPSRHAVARIVREALNAQNHRMPVRFDARAHPEVVALLRLLAGELSTEMIHTACTAAFPSVVLHYGDIVKMLFELQWGNGLAE